MYTYFVAVRFQFKKNAKLKKNNQNFVVPLQKKKKKTNKY